MKPVIRASAKATPGTVWGRVLPIDVQTQITASNGEDEISTYANTDGNFLLVGLAPGTFTVTLKPDPVSELLPSVMETIEVTAENDTAIGVIAME